MTSDTLSQPDDDAADVHEAEKLEEQVRPLFAGHQAPIQGAALAGLLASWLAGHHPEVRERLIELHIEGVRALIPYNDPWPPEGKLNG